MNTIEQINTTADRVDFLNRQRKRVQLLVIIFLVLCTAAVLISFKSYVVGLILSFLAFAFYLFVCRKKTKQYQQLFIEHSMIAGAMKGYTNVVYDCNKDLLPQLRNMVLFPLQEKASISLYHGFRASYHGIDLIGNECAVQTEIKDKVKSLSDITTLTGTTVAMSGICLPNVETGILFYDRKLMSEHLKEKLEKAGYREKTECSPLYQSDKYVIFADDSDASDEIIRLLCKSVKILCNEIDKPFAFSYCGDTLLMFITNTFYAQQVAVKYEVTEKALNLNRMPEFRLIQQFLDSLSQTKPL